MLSRGSLLRRLARTARAEVPALAVLGVLALAPIYLAIAPTHWLRGAGLVSAALVLAAVLRVALPDRLAGGLAVRSRWLDVVTYLTLAVLILLTGAVLPA